MSSKNRTRRIQRMLLAGGAVAALAAVARFARRPFDLHGKVVLITGGSRGLGLLLAREVASRGAKVAICGRNAATLARAADDLRRRGARALALTCDVTRQDEVHRTIHQVMAEWGRIDVLINNAGIIQSGPMEVMTLDDYRQAMDTHYWGPLYAILEVLPSMRRRGVGRIVNITSIGGKISVPHLLPYSASKFALVGLSEGLRAELAKDGIVITTICPGLMRTGSPRNALFKGKHRAEYAWFTISDSLPGSSMSAERAARQIVRAFCRGDAEVVLSLPAIAAQKAHGLAPGLVSTVLGWVNRLLPGPGGIGTEAARGHQSESRWTRSPLTALSARAAQRNNEM